MVDVATRTITAAVLRPTTKAVDASLLLARTATPEPMRPGWADALRMSRSVLPHQRLVAFDERLEHAAARPVIVPETIVCDHGKAFLSHELPRACRALGINFQPTHQGTPSEKPHIERTLDSVATLFAQYVAGYVGRSAESAAARPTASRCGRCSNCRTCWTSGSSRTGRTGRTTGCGTRSRRGGRSPRTRSTPRWSRRPATCRSRCPPTTTSSCCRRPGGRSTPTASRSTAAPTTATRSTPSGGSRPA